MKKLCILAGIIIFCLFLPSCKTAEEYSPELPYEWRGVSLSRIAGRGTYDSVKNESTIYLYAAVTSQLRLLENNIINWRIKLFVGDDFFIEINQDNYKAITGGCAIVHIDQPINKDPNLQLASAGGAVWVYAMTNREPTTSRLSSKGKPIPGDWYKGKNPDRLEVIITIKAFTGYIYEDSSKGELYPFVRN